MPKYRWDAATKTHRYEYFKYETCYREGGKIAIRVHPVEERGEVISYKANRDKYPLLVMPNEILDAPMTKRNASIKARNLQAVVVDKEGYRGPIGSGAARALKNALADLGMPNLVKRCWAYKTVTVTGLRRALYWRPTVARTVETTRLTYCYVFRSPMPDVPFSKFLKLAMLYKEDAKGMREGVKKLLANPKVHEEIESLDTLDILAGIGVKI